MKKLLHLTIFSLALVCFSGILPSHAATFSVTNNGDNGGIDPPPGAGTGTLRQAIVDANNTPGHDNIFFVIGGVGTVKVIQPITPLPALTDVTGVTIDGYTQPGAMPNTQPQGSPSNAVLLIELKGNFIPSGNGFRITTTHNTIRGIVINGFSNGTAIFIDGTTNSTIGNNILGCYIGTNTSGTAAIPNQTGIYLLQTTASMNSCTIGDATDGGRCLISGNQSGIVISGGGGTGVYGNYIGTDVNGMAVIGNNTGVVVQNGSTGNFIGLQNGRNIISGNGHGVWLTGSGTSSNYVIGNYIGLTATGTVALGNSGSGVRIEDGATNNEIGSYLNAVYRNIISGNGYPLGYSGIDIKDATTSGNIVQGNYIGTDFTGQQSLPNAGSGVSVFFGSNNNQIGGMYQNVISGNGMNGVWITDPGSNNNIVSGNLIGLKADGLTALPNSMNGVLVDFGATANQIGSGGPNPNYIAGNNSNGIMINKAGTNGSMIQNNRIGLNINNAALPNGSNGILISNNANNSQIGGINPFEQNAIAWNLGHGVYIDNALNTIIISPAFSLTGNNNIFNNSGDGVRLTGTTQTSITGPNEIHHNTGNGISVIGTSADFNTFTQNKIYSNGILGIDLGNNGITLNDANDPDNGPNEELNFPVLTSAVYNGSPYNSMVIAGVIDTPSPQSSRVDLYASGACDPTGYGEGDGYLISAIPDALGNWSVTYPGGSAGVYITATTTDMNGNTSEFSQCFQVTQAPQQFFEFGDAPEGVTAYPPLGVTGLFPTCKTAGPAGWIEHANFGPYFGGSVEPETDGNAGICQLPPPAPYNQDECFSDNDAGLLFPVSYTVNGIFPNLIITPCIGTANVALGRVCMQAFWGPNVEIHVNNLSLPPGIAYMNVLFDWNQDGQWGGSSSCPGGLMAAEHVLVNFQVPAAFTGPLSFLNPPPFLIGQNPGHVWARFTISDTPVTQPWDGSGSFNSGETEDYLLLLLPGSDSISVRNITIPAGTSNCYEAAQTITVAGNNTYFTVQNGGEAHFIAGRHILIFPTTTVQYGGKLHAYITTDGTYCNNIKSAFAFAEGIPEAEQQDIVPGYGKSFFKVYPNPTAGSLTLELTNKPSTSSTQVEIYSMPGEKMFSESLSSQSEYRISLSLLPRGVYILRVITGNEVGTVKVIRQ